MGVAARQGDHEQLLSAGGALDGQRSVVEHRLHESVY